VHAPCVPAPMSVARQASRGAALAWALACAAPAALLVAPGALALTLHVIQKAGAPLRLDMPVALRRATRQCSVPGVVPPQESQPHAACRLPALPAPTAVLASTPPASPSDPVMLAGFLGAFSPIAVDAAVGGAIGLGVASLAGTLLVPWLAYALGRNLPARTPLPSAASAPRPPGHPAAALSSVRR